MPEWTRDTFARRFSRRARVHRDAGVILFNDTFTNHSHPEHGVAAVAFGPGDIAQAHTADEFVELAEVVRAAQIVERFLLG